ncbi:MAG TPA: sodium:solute symporter family protein [Opitutaceae bacterium]|nr:sodium:solute symporter family protein [Opitutaceae bacterium]
MLFGSLHVLDALVVLSYLFLVVWIGRRASKAVKNEEGFFLAGRKLGKLYQMFLTFGNATEPQGAVSTASLVYQRGVTGVWFAFQTVFMNPYFWFMNTWFRRVRLVTAADLFEDRFASKGLSRLYAVFQVAVACVFLGFGNFVAYKITSSLVVKPEIQWTEAERASVHDFGRLKNLEKRAVDTELSVVEEADLATLRDRLARGELHSYITVLDSLTFYIVFGIVVGTYIVLGGMAAAAVNEALQGILIIVFSCLLLPTGLSAIGGWHALADKVPKEMMSLFSGSGGSPLFIFAVLFTSLVQIHGLSHNMGIYGSAKNEFAARFGGVTGAYLKRLMIILWAFAGLISIALFGLGGLADPDATWGAMTHRLLGPGLIGLMLAGVLAGTMSTLAAKALAVSSLFVRNVYRHIRPEASQEDGVKAARWAIIAVLVLGIISAQLMGDVESIVKLVLTVNVPFGAAVVMIFFWRRLTAAGVWWSVIVSVFAILVAPLVGEYVPMLSRNPEYVRTVADATGRPVPVYFKQVIRIDPDDPSSGFEGRGRLNFECVVMQKFGLKPEQLTPAGRETAQFLFDGGFPFLVLLIASWLSKPTDPQRVAQFYGKMKTPVGDTPELEEQAMEETRRNPHRFDHTKLFPRSSWEFTKWNREDTLGFLACCAVSAAIVGIFVVMLHLAST